LESDRQNLWEHSFNNGESGLSGYLNKKLVWYLNGQKVSGNWLANGPVCEWHWPC
jgi:hypothetical protein